MFKSSDFLFLGNLHFIRSHPIVYISKQSRVGAFTS